MLNTKTLIKPVMVACSAGLFLTACATYEDDVDYSSSTMESSSIREGSGAQTGWQSGSATRSQQQYSSGQQYSSQQYSSQPSSQQSYSSQSSQQLSGSDELVIPLHEERLNVGKRTVDAGTVTIRKVVTTETVNQPVELRKETLVIDREGGGAQIQSSASTSQRQSDADISARASAGGTGVQAQAEFDESEPAGASRAQSQNQQSFSGASSGNAFQEQTYTIQLREEQPVVEKRVVQTGQVVARKNAQTQRQTVQREVRREDVRLDQGANARNVEIRGNFDTAGSIREPAGAQPRSQDRAVESRSSTYQSETEIETETQYDSSRELRGDEFEDSQTLDDINQGSNTRGGAEDLQRFDEKANP